MAQESSLLGESAYSFAKGEQPLSEFGSDRRYEAPLGDVARAYRKTHTFDKKANKVSEIINRKLEEDFYSPAPIIRMGVVGAAAPASAFTVIANALASVPAGSGGFTTLPLPCASGLNTPAGMGFPRVGISHNS